MARPGTRQCSEAADGAIRSFLQERGAQGSTHAFPLPVRWARLFRVPSDLKTTVPHGRRARWLETAQPRLGAAPVLTSLRGASSTARRVSTQLLSFHVWVQPRNARRTRPAPPGHLTAAVWVGQPSDLTPSGWLSSADGKPTDTREGRAVVGADSSTTGSGLRRPARLASHLETGLVQDSSPDTGRCDAGTGACSERKALRRFSLQTTDTSSGPSPSRPVGVLGGRSGERFALGTTLFEPERSAAACSPDSECDRPCGTLKPGGHSPPLAAPGTFRGGHKVIEVGSACRVGLASPFPCQALWDPSFVLFVTSVWGRPARHRGIPCAAGRIGTLTRIRAWTCASGFVAVLGPVLLFVNLGSSVRVCGLFEAKRLTFPVTLGLRWNPPEGFDSHVKLTDRAEGTITLLHCLF